MALVGLMTNGVRKIFKTIWIEITVEDWLNDGGRYNE